MNEIYQHPEPMGLSFKKEEVYKDYNSNYERLKGATGLFKG